MSAPPWEWWIVGSERHWFSTQPDGFCLGSCSSAELLGRNQRNKSLVANQWTMPKVGIWQKKYRLVQWDLGGDRKKVGSFLPHFLSVYVWIWQNFWSSQHVWFLYPKEITQINWLNLFYSLKFYCDYLIFIFVIVSVRLNCSQPFQKSFLRNLGKAYDYMS